MKIVTCFVLGIISAILSGFAYDCSPERHLGITVALASVSFVLLFASFGFRAELEFKDKAEKRVDNLLGK